jgi:hypothetical protein
MTRPSPSYADFFSLADFEKWLAHERRTDLSDQVRNNGSRAILREVAQPALSRFIGALLEADRLHPLRGTEGRRGHLMEAWNGLFGANEDRRQHLDLLAQRFAPSFHLHALLEAASTRSKYKTARDAYDALVAKVDAGNLGWWETMTEDYCFVSGDRFNSQFRSWQFQLGQVQDRQFVPMQDISVAPLAECVVECETGELLIADWFRIDAFTESVAATEDPTIDINSSSGCIKRTEEYVAKHRFVSVFVGNSSPCVFEVDGTLVIGRTSDDDRFGLPSPSGRITTDLWWATIIDRQRLVDIVGSKLGPAAATAAVNEYLEKNDVLRLHVTPGSHHLYFAGHPDQFAEAFHSPDVTLDPTFRPMFILSSRPLMLAEKPSPSLPTP